MSHPKDRDLALWAGGDLPAGETERVQEHLLACPECRGLAEGLRASREGLELLGAEPVDPAALGRIRARVRDGVRRRLEEEGKRGAGAWPAALRPYRKWALAAALALAALGVGIWYQGARPGGPERVARTEGPTLPETPVEVVVPHPGQAPEAAPVPPADEAPARQARPQAPAPPAVETAPPVRRAALEPEPEPPTEPMVIQVVSDDPDIVYYWLVEPEESEDETVSS